MTEQYYYGSLRVDGVANTEVVDVILTSTEEEPKFIDAIAFIECSGTIQHDPVIVGYIEREKIFEIPEYIILPSYGSSSIGNPPAWFSLGHNLPVGQSFKVGHISGGTASYLCYTVRYQIKE